MSKRTCGSCTLCCRLLPVDEVDKVANQRCKHQCSKGCRVYNKPAMPLVCRLWNCQWVMGEDVGERPDRSHVVVDCLLDGARMTNNETGEVTPMQALQIWVDPYHKDAHRNERLRAWMADFTEQFKIPSVVVRYSSSEGFTMFPPWITGGRGWREFPSNVRMPDDPTVAEDRKALGLPPAVGKGSPIPPGFGEFKIAAEAHWIEYLRNKKR